MQFTFSHNAPAEAAQLFICTEAAQLHDETAQLLCNSLEEHDSFAETKLPVSGSLKNIAVLRFADLQTETLQKAAKEAAAWAQKQKTLAIDLNPLCAENAPRAVAALVAAIGEAVYRFDRFKKEASPAKLAQVQFVHAQHGDEIQAALNRAEALLYGVNLCKDLGNTGSNVCTPTYLAETAAREAQAVGAEAKILGGDYIRENMPSFWGVAKGSKEEPKLLELRYFGAADKSAQPIVLVGKGLTFDQRRHFVETRRRHGRDEIRYVRRGGDDWHVYRRCQSQAAD